VQGLLRVFRPGALDQVGNRAEISAEILYLEIERSCRCRGVSQVRAPDLRRGYRIVAYAAPYFGTKSLTQPIQPVPNLTYTSTALVST